MSDDTSAEFFCQRFEISDSMSAIKLDLKCGVRGLHSTRSCAGLSEFHSLPDRSMEVRKNDGPHLHFECLHGPVTCLHCAAENTKQTSPTFPDFGTGRL